MKTITKNRIGGVFAGTLICSLAGISLADDGEYHCPNTRALLAADIQEFARFVRCDGYPYPTESERGQWPENDPVWQWRGTKGNGCEVHYKLSKVLDDDAQEDPPTKKKGNNGNRGAANDILDHKDGSASDQLDYFIDTIKNDAKLNHPDLEHPHVDDAQAFITEALDYQACIGMTDD